MAHITCFDGVNCIGGNKILLQQGDSSLFFDFGTNYGKLGALYDEFMKPKTCTGLYEILVMGILPPIRDLYREDLVAPLADPWAVLEQMGIATRTIGEVSGVLVSHAHVDHVGDIHQLRCEIPIYASTMTAAICRALQDTAGSSSPGDYCYYAPKAVSASGALTSPRNVAKLGRKYRVTDSVPDSFLAYWHSDLPRQKLEAVDFGEASKCAGLNTVAFPADHSLYGACGWAVETDAGWIVYTGDIRMHGTHADLTWKFAESVARLNPVAMVIEGTRLQRTSASHCYTEADVYDTALTEIKAAAGRLVVADFGPRNVERLQTFLRVAVETGRELVILPKDAYLLHVMHLADTTGSVPHMDCGSVKIYNEYASSSTWWKDCVTEWYGKCGIGPEDVGREQGRYICCFSYWDAQELAYIKPVPGSLWIYSSCEAFNEEMQIDAKKLQAWVDAFGMRMVGRLDPDHGDDCGPLHVSGHASTPDLLKFVEIVRPKTLIPVHTTNPGVFVDQGWDFCRMCLPLPGMEIAI